MQFSIADADGTNGGNGGRPSKKKRAYIRRDPRVTPDQAEAEVRAKAAPEGTEFANCFELIVEARMRQEHSRD
jgi:hypothetical protein